MSMTSRKTCWREANHLSQAIQKEPAKTYLANPKLVKQSSNSFSCFTEGVRDYPLDDHALVSTMKGLRAFRLVVILRVVYQERKNVTSFLMLVHIVRCIGQLFIQSRMLASIRFRSVLKVALAHQEIIK